MKAVSIFLRVATAMAWLVAGISLADVGTNNANGIRQAVDNYLQPQMKGLPGQARYTVGAITSAQSTELCERLDVGMAAGARPWGRTHVSVRCLAAGKQKWALFVPVHIQVSTRYLVSARPVSAGQTLSEGDLQWMAGDLAELPAAVLTDAAQAVGYIATTSLPAGRPLRTDMLRQPALVQQGQSVKVITSGPGFEAANEGRALNNAAMGQVAQVRLNSGSVVSGLVRSDGAVDIRF
jgi:flagella basal body P-ring formation protein FlgA